MIHCRQLWERNWLDVARWVWLLTTERLANNRDELDRVTVYISIPWYDRHRPAQEPKKYLLLFHSNRSEIYSNLVARGRKNILPKDVNERAYTGLAESLSPYRTTNVEGRLHIAAYTGES